MRTVKNQHITNNNTVLSSLFTATPSVQSSWIHLLPRNKINSRPIPRCCVAKASWCRCLLDKCALYIRTKTMHIHILLVSCQNQNILHSPLGVISSTPNLSSVTTRVHKLSKYFLIKVSLKLVALGLVHTKIVKAEKKECSIKNG